MRQQKNEMQIALIRELADQGYSQATIAVMIGRTRERIRQICNREGIETLSGNVDWDRREKLADIIAAAGPDGISQREAATAAGFKSGSATHVFRSAGLSPRKRTMADRYRECADAGMTLSETARHFGKRVSDVWNEAHRAKPAIVFVGARGPLRIVGTEKHAELLNRYETGEPAKSLAGAFGVTLAGVYMALSRAKKMREAQVSA